MSGKHDACRTMAARSRMPCPSRHTKILIRLVTRLSHLNDFTSGSGNKQILQHTRKTLLLPQNYPEAFLPSTLDSQEKYRLNSP